MGDFAGKLIEGGYRDMVADFLDRSFMGVDVGRVLLALAILAAAYVLRRPFASLVLRQIRFATRHLKGDVHQKFIAALAPPIRFLPIAAAVVLVTETVIDSERFRAILIDVDRALFAIVLFWVLYRLIEPLLLSLDSTSDAFSLAMSGWVVRVARIVVLALGVATVLEIFGIKVGPILAGFGLVGAAVALGAQDLFKNLIAGIFIIAEKRFENGDWIRADGVVEGTVEVIGLRTTRVRRFDLAPVYVPNSQLADNAVINFQEMTYRRISWMVGLEYSTTIDQLREIRDGIEAAIGDNDDFVRDDANAPSFVRIDSLGDSAINVMVYCFTRSTDWGAWLKTKEALVYSITEIVEKAGSGFAFPSQSLYVESLPEGFEAFPGQSGQAQDEVKEAAEKGMRQKKS